LVPIVVCETIRLGLPMPGNGAGKNSVLEVNQFDQSMM
jgi:hypothetical protein